MGSFRISFVKTIPYKNDQELFMLKMAKFKALFKKKIK